MNSQTFAYNIRKNIYLFRKACEILYKIIQKCKKIKIEYKYIISLIKSDKQNKTIINKFGITCCYKQLLDCNNFKDFYLIITEKMFSFNDIMGAIYKFTYDNKIIELFVDNNKNLQKKIMYKFRKYFNLPDTFNYIDLKELIHQSNGEWFIPWIITYILNDRENLVRKNLNYDSVYIRKWDINPSKKIYIEICDNFFTKDNQLCKKSNYKVLAGNTYYKPTENSIFTNLMKKYNKEIIAGPSGSSVMTYQLLFIILDIIKNTPKNNVILLLLLIGDYVPIHHSICEILFVYINESIIPDKYHLKMNDLEYIFNLLNKYNPNLAYILNLHINKDNCDNLYFTELNKFLDMIIKEDYIFPDNQQTTIKNCINMNITKDCIQDIFHPTKDSVQFLLGRFNIVKNCFSDCKNYYVINLKIWSLFRNDLLIRYISTHKNIENKLIDEIFPIRIVLSNNNDNYIAPHKNKYIKSISELLENYFIEYNWFSNIPKQKKEIYGYKNLLDDKKKYSNKIKNELKTYIIDYPDSNIISREICIIQNSKMFFYFVFENDILKPFILISKYKIDFIRSNYKKYKNIKFEYVEEYIN